MTLRALDLLGRVERRELDRERQALAALAAEIVGLEGRMTHHEAGFGRELALALELPDGPRVAAAYALGHRRRQADLRAERGRLEAERSRLEHGVRERALSLKTLDLAAEELARQAAVTAARSEQKRLDTAAILRHATAVRSTLPA